MKLKKTLALLLTTGVFLGSFAALAPTSSAAKCPPTNLDGKTIGAIKIGSISVGVKSVNYPLSGELNPPVSPTYAGVSARHNPLHAIDGSSLITWHLTYNGCVGKLNPIINSKVGEIISVVDEKQVTQTYKISSNFLVPFGDFKAKWFRLDGPRQLVFVTCGGKLVNGRYTKNQIILAVPA